LPQILETGMTFFCRKSLLVLNFSIFCLLFSTALKAEENGENKHESLNPAKIILEHVSDGHEYHFATVNGKSVSIPLPVILYAPGKGFSVFMSSAFHHGRETYKGYMLMSDEFLQQHKLEDAKDASGNLLYKAGKNICGK